MLNFPNAPADGETSKQPNGITYQWVAADTRWIAAGTDNTSLVAGTVVQVKNFETGEYASGAGQFAVDDTIPQITEGNPAFELAFTPKFANSKLLIDVQIYMGNTGTGPRAMACLFQDSIANALATSINNRNRQAADMAGVSMLHSTDAGSTDTRTYKVRYGAVSAGTSELNGQSGGRKWGGSLASNITITEIQPDAVVPAPVPTVVTGHLWADVNGVTAALTRTNTSGIQMSSSKPGTGQYFITFDTPLPNANYSVMVTPEIAAYFAALHHSSKTVNGFTIQNRNNSNTVTDADCSFLVTYQL